MKFSAGSPSGSVPSTAPSSARASMLGSNLNMLALRKEMPVTPSTKMKQLQWDKLAHQQVGKTLWNEDEPQREREMLKKLQMHSVWLEMEEDFKAKQLVINLIAKQKQAELRSVLDPQTKKRVEILIQLIRKLLVRKVEPEEIAFNIQQFDNDMCTQVILGELKAVLPSPEQVGKLNVYKNSPPEEIAGLHPSDRLMVQLIKINRLGPRIEGMLYKVAFEDTWSLLDEGAQKLYDAGNDLLNARNFKQLLSLILLIGNYMNGTGIKGGAFGFRVSSINKLVDTKSVHNTTLLHFLERTVAKHFPEMEEFLDELERPAEAYRVNLQEIRKGLSELREGLKRIHQELLDHYTELEDQDRFGTQMWAFYKKANSQLEDLTDDVKRADAIFTDAISYYGEEDKNVSSSEFFGFFKTFVTSYKKCKAENITAAEEKILSEKRLQALADTRANRQKAREDQENDPDADALEKILAGLRQGNTRRHNKKRRDLQGADAGDTTINANDPSFMALDMLAQLKSDGFEMPTQPMSPNLNRRSRRRRTERGTESDRELPSSPLATEITDLGEFSTTDSYFDNDSR
ncbi:hypothetical protein CVT24_003257 [Panaeolus cyanescens]|uniref:FH2 domain-containing protein n=1 Tax=Panaeolus cyanescens TaxID=181874 RepID=A0A409W1U0_9AGAR|nr:hypothetical protein CVT24_003257 [Panaeolus cyanescens]